MAGDGWVKLLVVTEAHCEGTVVASAWHSPVNPVLG